MGIIPYIYSDRRVALVEQYGAKGDGVTDDTNALQAAIDTGLPVQLQPDKNYLISSTLTISTEGQTIDGTDATLSESTILSPMVSITADNTQIHGLEFSGSETAQSGAVTECAINVAANAARITDCKFSGKSSFIYTSTADQCIITGCRFDGFGDSAGGYSQCIALQGDKHIVSNCQFSEHGSAVTCGSVVYNSVITGNRIEGMDDNSIYLSSASNCTVSNNAIFNNEGSSGIKVRGWKNTIVGNTIEQAATGIECTPIAQSYPTGWGDTIIKFTSGSQEVRKGDVLTGATSGDVTTVLEVMVFDGSWAAGDAEGYIVLDREHTYTDTEAMNNTSTGANDVFTVGVLSWGGYGNIVANNTLENCSVYGIRVGAATDGGGNPYYQHHAIIEGNTLTECGAENYAALAVIFAFKCIVRDNTINDVPAAAIAAIQTNEAIGCEFTGNKISSGGTGLYCQKSPGIVISNNDITANGNAIRFVSSTQAGFCDKAVINDNPHISGNIVLEQMNFEFCGNSNVEGVLIIDTNSEITPNTYVRICANTFYPNRSSSAIVLRPRQGGATYEYMDISRNVVSGTARGLLIQPSATETANSTIRKLTINDNIFLGATTVPLLDILSNNGFFVVIDDCEISGGYIRNNRECIQITTTANGLLRISGIRAESLQDSTDPIIQVTGFAGAGLLDSNLGSLAPGLTNGPPTFDVTGPVVVDRCTLRVLSAPIAPSANVTEVTWGNQVYVTTSSDVQSTLLGSTTLKDIEKTSNLVEKSADPPDPAEGKSIIWQSDGTGSGDDGDIMLKITAGGVTKTITLVDYSAS